MSDDSNQFTDQVGSFQKIWMETFSRMAQSAFSFSPDSAPPEMIRKVGIGTRVRMIFKKVSEGFALPHWTIDEAAEQPANPWRYPQE